MSDSEKTKNIVMDTSILLHIAEYKVDVFEECKFLIEGKILFLIPSSVIREIKALSKNKGKRGVKAKTALLLIEKHKKDIKIVEKRGYADEVVLDLGEEAKIIATSDKMLKNRALKKGFKVITAKGKKLIYL